MSGVVGGFIAQAPNAFLTEKIGWRGAAWVLVVAQLIYLTAQSILCIEEQCATIKQKDGRKHSSHIQPTKDESIAATVIPHEKGAKVRSTLQIQRT